MLLTIKPSQVARCNTGDHRRPDRRLRPVGRDLEWNEAIPYWMVVLGNAPLGVGVELAGTPASRSLTGSVPVKRSGMWSGTAELQLDMVVHCYSRSS